MAQPASRSPAPPSACFRPWFTGESLVRLLAIAASVAFLVPAPVPAQSLWQRELPLGEPSAPRDWVGQCGNETGSRAVLATSRMDAEPACLIALAAHPPPDRSPRTSVPLPAARRAAVLEPWGTPWPRFRLPLSAVPALEAAGLEADPR